MRSPQSDHSRVELLNTLEDAAEAFLDSLSDTPEEHQAALRLYDAAKNYAAFTGRFGVKFD